MEIKAKCKYDLRSVQALTHLQMVRKGNPKVNMGFMCVLYGVFLLYLLSTVVVLGPEVLRAKKPVTIILLCIMAACILLLLYFYYLRPRIQYKSMAAFKDAENRYIFCDDVLQITSIAGDYTGNCEVKYSMFPKVYETSAYFFIFQTQRNVYLVDKTTIENGTAEDIRKKLYGSVKKYVMRSY